MAYSTVDIDYNSIPRSHQLFEFIPLKALFASKLSRSLSKKPGEHGFLWLYAVSNWFPIIAASLTPIANLNSIIALADRWRETADGFKPSDFRWVLAVNSVSLLLGCLANISLFLNYAKKIPYNASQAVSIGGFYTASALLLGLFISTKYIYFDNTNYERSQGFWNGVMTCILYFLSATLLLFNEIGHLRGYYNDSFNLTTRQRSIMVQNVALITWIGAGGAVFCRLIDTHFSDGVYWAVVTITTCGLGDIVPKTALSRALTLPFAFVGVIQLGLIVSTIRQIVLEAGAQTVQFHHSERRRIKELDKDIINNDQEAFDKMRAIRHRAMKLSKIRTSLMSISSFVIFTTLGAMVFYACEKDMNVFQCFYMCLLCLLTIGYGDYSPKSASSRAFFIVWGLAAIPLMTILVSSLGDTLFASLLEGGDRLGDLMLSARGEEPDGSLLPPSLMPNGGTSNSTNIKDMHKRVSTTTQNMRNEKVTSLCKEMRRVISHIIEVEDKVYEYQDWRRMEQLTAPASTSPSDAAAAASDSSLRGNNINGRNILHPLHRQNEPKAWLTETSPIRLPITESLYFLEKYFNALEEEVFELIDCTNNSYGNTSNNIWYSENDIC